MLFGNCLQCIAYVSLVSWSLGSVDLGWCGGWGAVWAYVWGACPVVSLRSLCGLSETVDHIHVVWELLAVHGVRISGLVEPW